MIRFVVISLFTIYMPIVANAQFIGGAGDGTDQSTIGPTRIDGVQPMLPYKGGTGDGYSETFSYQFIGANAGLSMYEGSSGDGHAYATSMLFMQLPDYHTLFGGGAGDGATYTLNQMYMDVPIPLAMYDGASGDGFGYAVAQRWMTFDPSGIYTGGEADGASEDYNQSFLGLPPTALYAGGKGDGFDQHTQILLFPAIICNQTQRSFVDIDASGTKSGMNWSNAFTSLPLAFVNAGYCPIDEIWVAEGVYYPTTGTQRGIALMPPSNVKIYGGFAGGEGQLAARDWVLNETYLSGDIGNIGVITDNSYHVVNLSNTSGDGLLDGFIIESGNANIINATSGFGGGIYNRKGSSQVQNYTIRNTIIRYCQAVELGAALAQFSQHSNLSLLNCSIRDNINSSQNSVYNKQGAKLTIGESTTIN